MQKLDKCTFGGSRAAIVLATMLNEMNDEKLSRKVCSLFSQYSQGMRHIEREIKDDHFKYSLLEVWYNSKGKDKANNTVLPAKVRSYLINVEQALYKVIRREDCADY
jgi:hypothetical protein